MKSSEINLTGLAYESPRINRSGGIKMFADNVDDIIMAVAENLTDDLAVENAESRNIVTTVLATQEARSLWQEGHKLRIEALFGERHKTLERLLSYQKYQDNPIPVKNGVTDEQLEQAREYPFADLFDGRLIKSGKRLVGKCPFHNERTPSFYIFEDNRYKCFGCGVYGSTIDYVMQMQNSTFLEAVRYLSK